MSNLQNFTFNSTGSFDGHGSFKIRTDSSGAIFAKKQKEYGILNFPIDIEIKKFIFVNIKKIGFGDVVDYFTTLFYIKKFLIYITKGNCGCETRRQLFNKWIQIPYPIIKIRTLYFDDKNIVKELKNIKEKNIEIPQIKPVKWKDLVQAIKTNTPNPDIGGYIVPWNKVKNSLKGLPIEKSETKIQNQETKTTKTNINNKLTPVKPEDIKGGCGCSKRKK